MIVTFTTKAYADIIMFGDIAIALIKMMGHSGTVPSAILADDVPHALTQLKQSLSMSIEDKTDDEAEEGEPVVSFHQRALPLIALMEAAIKQHEDMSWK
jgi:hypothetical protein